MGKTVKKKPTPSPQVLQRAAKVVLSGKCPLSKPTYLKLKKHHNTLRSWQQLKGKAKSKKAFVIRHKKQIGGFIPFLPLITGALGSVVPKLLGAITQ